MTVERLSYTGPNGTVPPRWSTPTSGAALSVQSNLLRLSASGSGGSVAYRGMCAPGLCGEVSGEFTLATTTTQTALLGIIGLDSIATPANIEYPGGVGFMIIGNTGVCNARQMDGTGAVIGSTINLTFNTTDRFRFRFQRTSGRVRAKVWNATTTPEPGPWGIDVANEFGRGTNNRWFGVSHFNDSGSVNYAWIQFDDFNQLAADL